MIAQVISRTAPGTRGSHRCHTHEEAGTHCPEALAWSRVCPQGWPLPGDSCGLVHRAGKRGGLREEGGWLRNTRGLVLDSPEVSQQASRFTPAEGDREAALCQGTGWDHETREDPPVPKGRVGKGVIPLIFHVGKNKAQRGTVIHSFIQGTQQLGRPTANRLRILGSFPGFLGRKKVPLSAKT